MRKKIILQYQKAFNDGDKIEFEMKYNTGANRYIAVGFGKTAKMSGTADTYICSVGQVDSDKNSGNVIFEDDQFINGHNPPYSVQKAPEVENYQRDNDYTNGVLSCRFDRETSVTITDEEETVFDLNEAHNLLVAVGKFDQDVNRHDFRKATDPQIFTTSLENDATTSIYSIIFVLVAVLIN